MKNLKKILFSLTIFTLLSTSCKTRQVSKTNNKVIDKTATDIAIKKVDIAASSTATNTKTDIKENASSEQSFENEETIKTEFNSAGKVKVLTVTKKSKGKINQASNKTDGTITDSFTNHSEIKKSDLSFKQKNDVQVLNKEKFIQAKDNSIGMWVGAGIFFCIVCFALFLVIKKQVKPG